MGSLSSCLRKVEAEFPGVTLDGDAILDRARELRADAGSVRAAELRAVEEALAVAELGTNVPKLGTVLLNIGLDVRGERTLSEAEVLGALRAQGAEPREVTRLQSDSEPTLVIELDTPLTEAQAGAVSEALEQEAIAQLFDGEGEIYGPKAEAWRPFNPEFFFLPDGTRANAAPVRKSPARWAMQQQTKGDERLTDFIRTIQDKNVDLKRVVGAVKKQIGDLGDKWDAYLQEELYHERAAKKTKDFLDFEGRPLLQEMQARGVTIEQLEEYLHNRHAEERNAQNAKVDPNRPDGGSGIETADARAYLAGLDPSLRSKYEALAKRVDAMVREEERLLVASGLEKQETIDAWRKAYKNYVPLQREEFEEDTARGTGQGFNVRGAASKRAIGSDKPVANILANVFASRERVITRAEKNRVATALYGMAIQAPNKDFWKPFAPDRMGNDPKIEQEMIDLGMAPPDAKNVLAEPSQQYVDPRSGRLVTRPNPLLRNNDNVLALRVGGEDRYVVFNARDPDAQNTVAALKNLDAGQLGRVMTISAGISRYFASINTQYNPIFGVVNLVRDVQGAVVNLTSTAIADKKAQVLRDTGSALLGIYADVRAHRKGRIPQSPWAQLWEEFQKEGGPTGFRHLYESPKARAEALEAELAKLTEGKAKAVGRATLDWLSDYNETMENAVRLAAYKAAKESGLTNQRAASLAKNLTVNFNRKGQVAQQAGALYAFFNASVQGTTRLLETVKGPAGKKIVAGGLLLGVLQFAALRMGDFEEDEPPEFIRDKNLILPIGDKKYLTLPMPLGLHILPATGRRLAEWLSSGGRDSGKRAVGFLGMVADAFNPIGNAGLSMQTLAPTPVDWLAALWENKDFSGRPIAREDFSSLDPTPGYLRARAAASAWSKIAAEYINLATGGTDFKQGALSPTPDQLDYFIGQLTGGLGREASKAAKAFETYTSGQETAAHTVPLLGRFYGDATGQAREASLFYANVKRLNEHDNEVDGLRKAKRGAEALAYLRDNPEARLATFAQRAQRQLADAKKVKAKLVERGAPAEQIKAAEDRITGIMRRVNLRVKSVKPASGREDDLDSGDGGDR